MPETQTRTDEPISQTQNARPAGTDSLPKHDIPETRSPEVSLSNELWRNFIDQKIWPRIEEYLAKTKTNWNLICTEVASGTPSPSVVREAATRLQTDYRTYLEIFNAIAKSTGPLYELIFSIVRHDAFKVSLPLYTAAGVVASYVESNLILDAQEFTLGRSFDEVLTTADFTKKRFYDAFEETLGYDQRSALENEKTITAQIPLVNQIEKAIHEVQDRLASRVNEYHIRLESNLDGKTVVPLDKLVKEVVKELVQNAIDAMPNGGAISVDLSPVGQEVVIRIMDTGPGMTPDILKHIFDLGFTTKRSLIKPEYYAALAGTSLPINPSLAQEVIRATTKQTVLGQGGEGLYLSKAIVEQLMRGRIEVASEVGVGTTFTLHLPNLTAERAESIATASVN
jgi:two-component sensor histidine kinase